MIAEDVFIIGGRGTVVVVKRPLYLVKVGDNCHIKNPDGTESNAKITGIEAFWKLMDPPILGKNIGLLLSGAGTVLSGATLTIEQVSAPVE